MAWRHAHRWTLAALAASTILLLANVQAAAQGNGSGILSVSLQAQSSISLVFVSYPAGPGVCPLTNSGTNNVGLYLGWATEPKVGAHGGCGQYTVIGQNTYEMSSPFYLVVNVSNLASTQYDLRAWVSAPMPIPGRMTYLLNSYVLTNARPAAAIQTNAYGTTTETFRVRVDKQQPPGLVSATVQFEATSR